MACFRVHKNKNFTVMSNHHLQNKKLSLRAKGLLSVMLSLPEDWDYTLKGLTAISREGVDAIRVAIKELEQEGYLKRSRERDANGCLKGTLYSVYEVPQQNPSNLKEEYPVDSIPKKPILEKPILENPTLEKPILEKPTQVKPILENPTQLNTNNINTLNKINTNPINSIHSDEKVCNESEGSEWTVQKASKILKSGVKYDELTKCSDRDLVDSLFSIMVEMMCTKSETMRISGQEQPMELVRQRILGLRFEHMQYMCEVLANMDNCRNIKAYMRTMIFNAVVLKEVYYGNLVNSTVV